MASHVCKHEQWLQVVPAAQAPAPAAAAAGEQRRSPEAFDTGEVGSQLLAQQVL